MSTHQYGKISHPSHRYSSRHRNGPFPDPIIDHPPLFYTFATYLSCILIHFAGVMRDIVDQVFHPEHARHLKPWGGYAPLVTGPESVYNRRMKVRIADCVERPTTGVPGRYITLLDRASPDHNETLHLTGTTTDTLNLSSYNYLGFAESEGLCADGAEDVIRRYGICTASTRAEVGTQDLHDDVEPLVARFVGKEASLIFSTGFSTNAYIFPPLVGQGCLIISDELNHASIRFGARLSGASIVAFQHNNMDDLEAKIRSAISRGQPGKHWHRPWRKILVVVEGLYSMEGTMCNLPGIIRLKRRYKFYLFVDEAHSIGAIGPKGRGVCDYFGIDPSEVDILMGTFTKSFGAVGGYIAADQSTVNKLRAVNACTIYGEAIVPAVVSQIATSLRIIQGEALPGQGEERLQRLAFNSRYLRLGLKRLGFIIYGHDDSPIIPLLLYNPGKMTAFSRIMLEYKISVVIVPYPAVPLKLCRVRFCVSAAHNAHDLNRVLAICDRIGDVLDLKLSTGIAGGLTSPSKENGARTKAKPPRWQLKDVVKNGPQDVQSPLY